MIGGTPAEAARSWSAGCATRRGSCDSRRRRAAGRPAQSRQLGSDRRRPAAGRAASDQVVVAVARRRRRRTPPPSWRAADVAGVWTVTTTRWPPTRRMPTCAALAGDRRRGGAEPRVLRAHLPDARLRRRAGGAARSGAGHRRASRSAAGATARRCIRGRCSRASWSPRSPPRDRRRTWCRSRSAPSAPMPPRAAPGAPVTAKPAAIDAAALRQSAEAPFQEAKQAVDLVAGRAHRRRRPRHQGAGAPGAGRAAGRRLRRRAGRVAADLRQRLAADGAPDRQLGPDGGAEAVRRRSASRAPSSTWSA